MSIKVILFCIDGSRKCNSVKWHRRRCNWRRERIISKPVIVAPHHLTLLNKLCKNVSSVAPPLSKLISCAHSLQRAMVTKAGIVSGKWQYYISIGPVTKGQRKRVRDSQRQQELIEIWGMQTILVKEKLLALLDAALKKSSYLRGRATKEIEFLCNDEQKRRNRSQRCQI